MNNSLFRLRSKIRNTLYHFKVANWTLIRNYNRSLCGTGFPPYAQLLLCSWRHGATFESYYEFCFFRKNTQERRTYVTPSLRHELTRQVNDDASSLVLKDKEAFALLFKDMLGRKVLSYKQLVLLQSTTPAPPNLVVKKRFGQAGDGVFFPGQFDTWAELFEYIEDTCENPDMYIFEEYIEQHHLLNRINPGSVNTLRIVTYYNEVSDEAEIWGVHIRFGVDSAVDNLATGGIGAFIDIEEGVCKSAVKKDPFSPDYDRHPVTNEKIIGLKIPYYSESINMAKEAAKKVKKVKSIGWDVAITENGPCLIEGNDNWCMVSLQICEGKGMRNLASAVCDMQMVYD